MTTFESNFFAGNMPCVAPVMSGVLYTTEGTVDLPATVADGDIAKICYLPADCVPVDVLVQSELVDTDNSPTFAFSVGLLNDAEDAIATDTTLLAGSILTSGATATSGLTFRGAGEGLIEIERDKENDRIVAVEVTADPATGAAGKMRVVLTFRASQWGS